MMLFKRLLELLFLLVCLFLLLFQPLVKYGLQQARGQANIILNAEPIDELLKQPEFPDSLKQKLRLVSEIKAFAFDNLGINYSKNYSTLYDQKGKSIMFVVTACKPYSFDAFEWDFPILGSVPYKGFFVRSRALVEYYKMKELGYDTHLSTVSGWSTLGWFTDPVLSNMLDNTEGDLAELLIHELTHGTLFVKNNATFNENLASFVGYKGAIQFLKHKYGEASDELNEYINDKKDERLINVFMLNSASLLDSLYKSFNKSLADSVKDSLKMNTINRIIASADTLDLKRKERLKRYVRRSRRSKNAFFMQFVRYDSKYDELENEFQKFNGNFNLYLTFLKKKYPS